MDIETAKATLTGYQWKHPDSYGGYSPDGDYVIYTRTRDSEVLDESNYIRIFEDLEKLNPDDWEGEFAPCHDFRASHWACGWVEYIIVKADAPDAMLIKAAEIVEALEQYPIYDESDFCEREHAAKVDYWDGMLLSERVEMCKEVGDSIFAARHDYIPDGCYEKFHEWEW